MSQTAAHLAPRSLKFPATPRPRPPAPIRPKTMWSFAPRAVCGRMANAAPPFKKSLRLWLIATPLFDSALRFLLCQPFLVLLSERRIARAGVDLARLVFAGLELLLGPDIVELRDLGALDHPLHQVGRNERHAFVV